MNSPAPNATSEDATSNPTLIVIVLIGFFFTNLSTVSKLAETHKRSRARPTIPKKAGK
jgi:hypothetical protein